MSDNRIQLLSDHVCNKIAAGEVIERPASVFKELIENAIDAGATSVEVDVLQGGRKAVIVTDNGHGMSRDDALLSLERHATSKISDVDDIEFINTMGFRGEAVPAIAAVSRFKLTTRQKDDLSGTEITVDGGTVRDVTDAGCPVGTSIEVRNLFFNVPARRKFLRTEATELANIRNLFQVFALAHPEMAMRLTVDGREWMRLPSHKRFEDRVSAVHGPDLIPQMRQVSYRDEELHVYGFASLPTTTRNDRKDQIVLINQRPASAPLIGYAIKQAYDNSLPRDRHPILFLFLDMPPDWVDVNVHPTKREVRFRAGNRIRDAVIFAIRTALQGPAEEQQPAPTPAPQTPPVAQTPKPAAKQVELPTYPPVPLEPENRIESTDLPPITIPRAPDTPPVVDSPDNAPWKAVRILGQLNHRFVVMETDDGMVLMDPQAAYERVLFEQTEANLENSTPDAQKLLTPETVELSAPDAVVICKHLDELERIGFSLSEFGGDSFLIEAIPSWFAQGSLADLLTELVPLLEQADTVSPGSKKLKQAAARSCCQLAAKRKKRWTTPELQSLVDQLATCRMPYTTPFGRSTIIFTGFNELKRKFGIR